MAVKFCPLASGSSGNSTYIGTEHTHILVDAGLSGKRLTQGLAALQVDAASLSALFITHEHTDHIQGAGILSRRFDLPIYATCGTWDAMEEKLGAIHPKNKRFVYDGEPCVINDISVHPFDIPHDAAEPVGYSVCTENIKMTIATDMGHITDRIKEMLTDSHILLLEANHDEEMVKNGPYPSHLKRRILGKDGHLSNHMAGMLLAEIMTGKMQQVFLGHLSAENNLPRLAYSTVAQVLKQQRIQPGRHLTLDMAMRSVNSRLVEL